MDRREKSRLLLIGHKERGTFDFAHRYEEYHNRQEYTRIRKSKP